MIYRFIGHNREQIPQYSGVVHARPDLHMGQYGLQPRGPNTTGGEDT